MIEILHGFMHQNHRNYGSIVYTLGHAGFISSTVVGSSSLKLAPNGPHIGLSGFALPSTIWDFWGDLPRAAQKMHCIKEQSWKHLGIAPVVLGISSTKAMRLYRLLMVLHVGGGLGLGRLLWCLGSCVLAGLLFCFLAAPVSAGRILQHYGLWIFGHGSVSRSFHGGFSGAKHPHFRESEVARRLHQRPLQ